MPVLYCSSRWLLLHFEGGSERGESGIGGVIFEQGERFLKKFVYKKKLKKEQTAFYILPVVNFRVLNLVLAGLL